MRGGVNVVGGEEVGDPALFTLLLGFYGLSRNPRPLVRMLWERICVKIYQENSGHFSSFQGRLSIKLNAPV